MFTNFFSWDSRKGEWDGGMMAEGEGDGEDGIE
jgi:hypothetical protein